MEKPNTKLIFVGSETTKEHELELHANAINEIFIQIKTPITNEQTHAFITLDKLTAIKLSKELRRQISYL
jgi:hypothetical protein